MFLTEGVQVFLFSNRSAGRFPSTTDLLTISRQCWSQRPDYNAENGLDTLAEEALFTRSSTPTGSN